MRTSPKVTRTLTLLGLSLVFLGVAAAQTVSLGLGSGSGTPGSVVSLSLSVASTTPQPASLQWTLSYATKDFTGLTVTTGAATSAASKSVNCNSASGLLTCVVSGVNSNTIANGVVATINFTLSASTTDTSSVIQVSGGVSSSLGGSAIPVSTTGGTVTIQQTQPTITGLSCTPDSVVPPAPSTCVATISAAAPAGGTTISLSDNSSNAVIPQSVLIPAGSTYASFQVATSPVISDTQVNITATLGTGSPVFPLWLGAASKTGIIPDASVTQSSPSPATSVTSPALSTAYANELLLAFVAAGSSSSTVTATSVTGASLTWVLVKRTNAKAGTAEIWRAFAPAVLSSVTVTAQFSASVYGSITVMSFEGVDPSGTSGSGAIGATASVNAASGAASATLTTTRDGSLVLGVGNDPTSDATRIPGSGQNLVSQDLATPANSSWVQTEISTTPSSGTAISINDISPTADAYNLSAVEILAPSYCLASLVPVTRSFSVGGSTTSVTVATGTGCPWTATTDSPTWVSFSGGSGNGNGTFTLIAAANSTGQARLGTVTVAGQSFKVMEAGSVELFTDVPMGTQFFDYMSLMYSAGVTAGCSASPLEYCPTGTLPRDQMATFVVSALQHIDHAAGGLPSSYPTTPYFNDVPTTEQFFPFVQVLAQMGITNGCQASPPLYCPSAFIIQGQMAKFMILGWLQYTGQPSFTYTKTPYFT
ncbi:MAG: cohesin domain-containing protein, partial [Candidatus Korobacteraceae bacterium]